MPTYAYQAVTSSGRIDKGTIKASSVEEARILLYEQGLTPQKITRSISFGERLPSRRDLATFAAQFAAMHKASIKIPTILDSIAPQFSSGFRQAILSVSRDVTNGLGLAEAMERHKRYFGELLISLVRAGESTSQLDPFMMSAAYYLKKAHVTSGKIRGALTYPLISLAVALIVAYSLMIFIVPQFANMLTDTGAELPMLTKIVLAASNFLRKNFLLLLASIVALTYLFSWWKRGPGKKVFDHLVLKIPGIGPILRLQILSQIARLWALMDMANIKQQDALIQVANSIQNYHYSNAIKEIQDAVVNQGASIGDAFERYPHLFPTTLIAYIRTGVKSSTISEVLSQAAEFFEEEMDALIGSLESILEPAMMLFIGAIVLVIILAVLLPYFKLTQSFM